jgi:hypothetical protein
VPARGNKARPTDPVSVVPGLTYSRRVNMQQNPIYPDRWAIGPRKYGWPNMTFSVTFEMTSKQLIESITVMSYYGNKELPTVKMLHYKTGPFDEIGGLIQDLITECAIQQYEQLELDLK